MRPQQEKEEGSEELDDDQARLQLDENKWRRSSGFHELIGIAVRSARLGCRWKLIWNGGEEGETEEGTKVLGRQVADKRWRRRR